MRITSPTLAVAGGGGGRWREVERVGAPVARGAGAGRWRCGQCGQCGRCVRADHLNVFPYGVFERCVTLALRGRVVRLLIGPVACPVLDELESGASAYHEREDGRERREPARVAYCGYALEDGHEEEVSVRQLGELLEQDLRHEVPPRVQGRPDLVRAELVLTSTRGVEVHDAVLVKLRGRPSRAHHAGLSLAARHAAGCGCCRRRPRSGSGL